MNAIPNRPTPEGIALGTELARLTEPAVQRMVSEGTPDERCKSCAFREGTIPNGCLPTFGRALKCVMEQTPFYCHQTDRAGKECHGYVAAVKGCGDAPPVHAPWMNDEQENQTDAE